MDRVLGGQVEWESAVQGELEAAVSKVDDGRFGVVHAHGNSGSFVVVDGESLLGTPVLGLEDELQFARCLDLDVGRLVLVGVCVPAHNNGLFPGGYQTEEKLSKYYYVSVSFSYSWSYISKNTQTRYFI